MHRSFLILGLVLGLGLAAFGQKQKTQPQTESPDSASAQPPGSKSKRSAKKSDGVPTEGVSPVQLGTSLEAVLQSSLDVRKSQVGDEVVLKTTKAVKQDGEVVIPKGTELIGRITEVQRKTKDNTVSRLGMVFERAHGKNIDMPLNASVVSVITAQATAAAGDVFASDISGSGSGRATSGGGGGLLSGVGSTVGGVVNTAASTVGNVAGSATNTLGQTTGTVGRTVGGLQITQAVSGSANTSSTFSANGKDVKIDKGATFRLQVAGAAGNPE